jgi:hypothetical protein
MPSTQLTSTGVEQGLFLRQPQPWALGQIKTKSFRRGNAHDLQELPMK